MRPTGTADGSGRKSSVGVKIRIEAPVENVYNRQKKIIDRGRLWQKKLF